MAENLLISYVNGELPLEELIKWLNSPEKTVKEGDVYNCDVQDFVLYFLNFLHSEVFIHNTNNNNINFTTQRQEDVNKLQLAHSKSIGKKNQAPESQSEFINSGFEVPNLSTSTPKAKNKPDLNSTWPRRKNEPHKKGLNFNFKDHSLCLGDFVTNKKPGAKQKRRRIKPTFIDAKVQSDSSTSIELKVQNKENFEKSVFGTNELITPIFTGVSCKNVEESRSKILEDLAGIQKNNLRVEATSFNYNNMGKIEITPLFENCTNRAQISLIAKLFICFIKSNFILNLLSELYSLITLLVSKQFKEENRNLGVREVPKFIDKNDLRTIFQSLHNQVFFSLEILSNVTNYLRIFDKPTLNLLLNNQRVGNFNKKRYKILQNALVSLINEKQSDQSDQNSNVLDVRNVNFSTETDNRDNFICDTSFHAFRKQRDMFYDILKIWEDKHKNPDWNFSAMLSYKIKVLLNLCSDSINFRQFAKLFKSQLLLVSHKDIEGESHNQNEEAILQHFPGVDSSKLNKLKQRLSSKSEAISLDSPPSFLGYQEFFKDFILTCSNNLFLEHLKDVILEEILVENDFQFTGYDLSRRGNILKNQAIQSVKEKLTKLLVLAKFLGFLESLPFQSDFKRMSKKIVQNQISMRGHYRAIIDIKRVLTEAKEKNRIAFTTCWIATYLSMLDYITLRLPYFEEIISILFQLYVFDTPNNCYTKLLLFTSLNWLFGLSQFPNELYYNFLFNKPCQSLSIKEDTFKTISEEYFVGILNGNTQNNFPIDKLDLITKTTLHSCCPTLESFKNLLSSTTNDQNTARKHITPLTKIEPQKSKEQIQKQLEDAFLNSQTHTVRKIIEFCSERVTSGCIQHLSTQLGQIKRDTVKKTDANFKHLSKILGDVKKSCTEISDRIILEKTELAMKGLMPPDELSATVRKCTEISVRICKEKIQMWIDVTVTSSSVEKILVREGRRVAGKSQSKVTSNLPSGGRNIPHSENTLSAVKILDKLKLLMINTMEYRDVTEFNIKMILTDCRKTIEFRCDVNDNITLTIHKLTLEFYVVLVCFNPDLAKITLELFQEYWIYFKVTNDVFKEVVCIRNVHMLSKSKDRRKSWDIFGKLLVMINKNDLVTNDVFEQQCLEIFKRNWDEETLQEICNCYKNLIENLKDRKFLFHQLLSFISSYCLDLNNF